MMVKFSLLIDFASCWKFP